ncbi:carboxymuconolactone decarboxylase family protein [Aquabacterium sp.]|uniref:carboxymuconolactone decarboxylase family protein n=1 Tax=Aquabacterium sp. TaxID=1872578 RepID=UPI002B53DC7C|nr:carboxymuconolactone decarboxylase family protein [Aquabacterium sp.]HSW03725.1 carboxymuconolactone decarboxylase family protein [Aquabacterium sp.]
MSTPRSPVPIEQGHGGERLPLPPTDRMDAAQRAAAQALIDGPRKAVYGPFVPLMRVPALLERTAQLGESLRFGGQLPVAVRELVTALVAQRVGNQFEWVMHVPLAQAAGIPAAALEAIRLGHAPTGLPDDAETAYAFCAELMATHGVGDALYQRACAAFGEAGVVELSTLIGYFTTVSWLMNVARTPSRPTAEVLPLP